MQHGKACLGLGLPVADHVGVRQRPGCHQLLLSQIFYRVQTVSQAGRQLKFQVVRGGEHLPAKLLGHRLVIPLQKLPRLEHGFPVLGAAFALLAPPGALVHVIVQAGALLANIPGELLMAAGQLEGQANGLHHIVGHGSAAVGAVIIRAVVRRFADHGDDRVNVLHVKP